MKTKKKTNPVKKETGKEVRKIKIIKKDLQEALSIVKPGLAASEIIEQTTSFAFIKGHVVTYNDEISISHPIKGIDLRGAIPAQELYALLGKITKETVTLEIENSMLMLKAGRSKAGFVMEHKVVLPLDEVTAEKNWTTMPDGLLAALRKSAVACSKDQGRPLLLCVHINSAGYVEGCDANRLSRVSFSEEFPISTMLIPATAISQVLALDPSFIAETDGWCHFKNIAGTVISTRILEDDVYPNTSVLLNNKPKIWIHLPSSVKGILLRAEPFWKRSVHLDELLHIEIKEGKLTLKAEAENNSWFVETLPIDVEEDIAFSLSPHTLFDIIEADTEIGVTSKRISLETKDWQYICAIQ